MANHKEYTLFAGVSYPSGETAGYSEFTGTISDVAMKMVEIMSNDDKGVSFTFTVSVSEAEEAKTE